MLVLWYFFFFKQKTAYEVRISDWSSDVCSSDLMNLALTITRHNHIVLAHVANNEIPRLRYLRLMTQQQPRLRENPFHLQPVKLPVGHYPQGYLVHLPVNQIIQRRAVTQIGRASGRERVCQNV